MNVMGGNRFVVGQEVPLELFPNSGFTLSASSIHGIGIHATRAFSPGEAIARLKGKLVRGSAALSDPNYIGIGRETWIDPILPFCAINHSCSPTAAFGIRCYIHAIKQIESGDEITIDYSTTEVDPDWEMTCECGANTCRGTLRAIQFDYPDIDRPPLAAPLMLRIRRRALQNSPFARTR